MPESKENVREPERVEIDVTNCPECGREWERVVTHRRDAHKADTAVQW